MQSKNQLGFRFTKTIAWQFFLVIAFPIHFWALILWFQEFDVTTTALDSWAAVGEGGYFLIFALFESGVIFLLITLLLLLLPKSWNREKVFLTSVTIYLIVAGWFILEQARYLEVMPEDNWLIARLLLVSLRTNTGKVLAVIFLASVIAPPFLLAKNEKLQSAVSALVERINILSYLYLFLDAVGVIIIFIRNVF